MRRAYVAVGIVLLLSAIALGCAMGNECLSGDNVIDANLPLVALSDLTTPVAGRNITPSTHEDRITATIEPLPAGSTNIEIRLVAEPGVTWWKAVEARAGGRNSQGYACDRGVRVAMAETQDQSSTGTIYIPNSVAPAVSLVFWKAKAAGVHTPMYQLSGNLGSLSGQRLVLRWEVD